MFPPFAFVLESRPLYPCSSRLGQRVHPMRKVAPGIVETRPAVNRQENRGLSFGSTFALENLGSRTVDPASPRGSGFGEEEPVS